MSAEGKKKRGFAGVSNAANIPFRYHGYPRGYSLSTAIGHSDHPRMAGSKLINAMIVGYMLGQQGYHYNPSTRMYAAADSALD